MAMAVEQLVIDQQSRFLEMKSVQLYSTTDEYLYAMREDLADWLSTLYPEWTQITAETFLESLENGVLLCQHANNVNEAARKMFPSSTMLINCKYRSNVRPQTFNARDNVSQFITWARHVACVREVLMFESDDLILRKNEKNFILCLLEIARFGAKFGISVPSIIKLEDEIEREIEHDKQTELLTYHSTYQYLQRLREENEKNKLASRSTENDLKNNTSITTVTESIQNPIPLITVKYSPDDHENNKPLSNSNASDSMNNDNDKHIFDTINYQSTELEHHKDTPNSTNYEFIDNENFNSHNLISLTDSNDINSSQHNISHESELSLDNSKRRQNSDDSYENTTTSSDINTINTPIINSQDDSQHNQSVTEPEDPIIPPASSSHLHKTVVQIVNSCCCSQRFPVIRIGEGKYRIGENGTIIFIRILRNHVMVRVGGGWDTLENYLNKHDPCRRSGHHRLVQNDHHHSDIPIIAIPNTNVSPSVQKNTPYGRSITIKTEEFPLAKPTVHDTNLADAQLVITRGADGRHHIGQITYKTEEDTLNQSVPCPHHHVQSPPTPKIKARTPRTTTRPTSSSTYNKQSSPSTTDQDYSSLEATPSKPSSSSSLDLKQESIEELIDCLDLTPIENQRVRSPPFAVSQYQAQPNKFVSIENAKLNNEPKKLQHPKSDIFISKKPNIVESVIDTIDGYVPSMSFDNQHDFNISDIEDVMGMNKKSKSNDDATHMDNDSLESCEGVVEEKKVSSSSLQSVPTLHPTKKPGGYCSALYLAQQQKYQQEQAANRKRFVTNLNRLTSRSTTLGNVVEAAKKEEQPSKQRRRPLLATKRAQSSEIIEKLNDGSKLDRDSGFDEQDFRRERLQSNGDDNSSISSIISPRSSINLEYKENKSSELRMKKFEHRRSSNQKEPILKSGRTAQSLSRRSIDTLTTTTTANKYRKNSQPIVNPKQQMPPDERSVVF